MVAVTIKKESVLVGNKPSGNHGNCSENVKRQALSAPAGGISVIELLKPSFVVFLPLWFHSFSAGVQLSNGCRPSQTLNREAANFITFNLFIHSGVCLKQLGTKLIFHPSYPEPLEISLKRLTGLSEMDGSIKQQTGGRWGGGSITVGLEDERWMALRVPEKLCRINTSEASAQKQRDR